MKTSGASLSMARGAVRFHARLVIVFCVASGPWSQLRCVHAGLPPGALDPSFVGRVDGSVNAILIQPDGHLLVGGNFSIPGVGTNLVRLMPDGAPDVTFAPSPAVWGMTRVAIQSDGKVLVGKTCGVFRPCYAEGLSRLFPDGSEDTSFRFRMPPDYGSGVWSGFWTMALGVQADGRILLAGCYERDHFDYWYWTAVTLQRLLPDGTECEWFSFTGPQPEYISTLVLLPDQRLLVAGDQLARWNADGTEDTRFVRTILARGRIECCITQADGKILIGGSFTNIQGHTRCGLARMLPDGQLDLSFNPPVSPRDTEPEYTAVWALAVQTDGRVLVGGNFERMNGLFYPALARLNSDGSLDTTFPAILGLNEDQDVVSVRAIALQGEDRALIGGSCLVTADGFDGGDLLRIYLGAPSPRLSITRLPGGMVQLRFAYSGSYEFSVLTATNLSLPASNWDVLGSATNIGGGFYQFTDRVVRSEPQRYYQLRGMGVHER